MNWLKQNILSIINLLLLVYLLVQLANLKTELDDVRDIATKTAHETELNNSKLDYVESDINSNSRFIDSMENSKKK